MSTLLSTRIVWLKLDHCDDHHCDDHEREQSNCLPTEQGDVFGRTLRVALAMRGGISLAVWIGGAVAELDVFRRIRLVRVDGKIRAYLAYTPEPGKEADEEALYRRADIYARMLLARGYDTIEFDILAGASAGGLNGVLYAVAQRAGANVDSMLDVWLEAGDIWTLLRRHGVHGVDSVLRGDEYFWRQMQAELAGLYSKPGRNGAHVSQRVTLDLSATITDGVDVPDGDSQEGYGHFHFIGTDECASEPHPTLLAGREIPREAESGDDPSIVRLAYAARTTSAFPGAFEPALVASYAITDPSELATSFTDLSFAFAAHRSQATPAFHVVDGGVKDNIPIDRAFRSIKRSPFDDFSTRTLLYLDPSAVAAASVVLPAQGASAPGVRPASDRKVSFSRNDSLSHFIGATITSLKKFALRESGEQEIQAVEDFRRGLLAAEARSRAAAQSMRPAGCGFLPEDAEAAIASYVRARATADVIVLDDILQHPAQWQLGTNLPSRRLRMAANAHIRELVEQQLLDAYGRNPCPDAKTIAAIAKGPQALQDTVRSAAGWLRFLEEATFYVSPETRQDFAPSFDLLRAKIDAAGRAARAARERFLDDLLAAAVARQLAGDDEGAARAIVDHWTTPQPIHDALWTADLAEAVDGLQLVTRALQVVCEEASPINLSIWSKRPLEETFHVNDLAPFVAGLGIPEPLSDLRFRSITSSEEPSETLPLSDLRDSREIARARSALKGPAGPTRWNDVLGAETKLGGIALHNFGGFLSREWRRKDWWWGRLDAAAGMLRFLGNLESVSPPDGHAGCLAHRCQCTPVCDEPRIPRTDCEADKHGDHCHERLSPRAILERPDAEDLVDAVQQNLWKSATGPSDGAATSRGFAADIPALGHLRSDYLSAVASRIIRILSRTLVRAGTPARPAKHVAVWLVRPIVVVLPLLFNPARAFLAIALVLTAIVVLDPSEVATSSFVLPPTGRWPGRLFAAAVIGVVLIAWVSTLVTFVKSESRWRIVRPTVDGETAPRRVKAMRNRARRHFWGEFAVATGVVTLLAVVVPQVARGMIAVSLTDLEFWVLFAGVLLLLGAAARAATSLRAKARVGVGAILCVVVGVGVLVLAEALFRSGRVAGEVRFLPSLPWLVVGCVAAVVTALLFYGWKAGLSPRRRENDRRSDLLLRGLGAAGAWLGLSLLSGIFTAAVAWLVSALLDNPSAVVLPILVAYSAWGTAAWWLGEIPTSYEPRDDLARART